MIRDIFEKKVSADDIRKGSFRIPKKHAKSFNLIIGEDIAQSNESLQLSFLDKWGQRVWDFNYTYWRNSYQFDGTGWTDFAQHVGLREGDVVSIKTTQTHQYCPIDQNRRFFIYWSRPGTTAEYSGLPVLSQPTTAVGSGHSSFEQVFSAYEALLNPDVKELVTSGNSSLQLVYPESEPLSNVDVGESVTDGTDHGVSLLTQSPAQQEYSTTNMVHSSVAMTTPLYGTSNFNTEASNPSHEHEFGSQNPFMRYIVIEDQPETAIPITASSASTMGVSGEASSGDKVRKPENYDLDDMAVNKSEVSDPINIFKYFKEYQHYDSRFARQLKSLSNNELKNGVMRSVGTIISILRSTPPGDAIAPDDFSKINEHREILGLFGMEIQPLDAMIKSRLESN